MAVIIGQITSTFILVSTDNMLSFFDIQHSISAYNTALKQEAFNYLSTAWGTTSIDIPESMAAPFMKLLELPKLTGFDKTAVCHRQSIMNNLEFYTCFGMAGYVVLKIIDIYTCLQNLVSDICQSREFNQKVHSKFNILAQSSDKKLLFVSL